jgi:hypothetical protein
MSENKENLPPTFYHHKPIKKFYLDGIIQNDAAIARLRIEYAKLLESEMRINGYVPRLDLDPDFTIRYNEEKDFFEFELSMHSVYAGKRNSEWIAGIDGTKPIPTLQSKSVEFSQDLA